MNKQYNIPTLPVPYDLETKEVIKRLTYSHRKLAELKGVALTKPNERILISTLTLQEVKYCSEVENIVTTQDDLYKADLNVKQSIFNASTKEVLAYREAIEKGFQQVRKKKLLTNGIAREHLCVWKVEKRGMMKLRSLI